MDERLLNIQNKLYKKLSENRYYHSIGVRYTAACLAMRYGESIEKAEYAALLHDCAKYMSGEEMYKKCKKYDILISKEEKEQPNLLHGKLGAYYAEHKYGITDTNILSAIECHTTGKPNMNLLEKILFIADYIEPNRKIIPGIDEIRKYAFEDIDKAVFYKIKNMSEYLLSNGIELEGIGKETYEFYINNVEKKLD